MNFFLSIAALCLFGGLATAQTGCNLLSCISQQQTWTSASASGNKDRICSAGRSYRDCLGSSCSAVVAPVTRLLEQQGCGSSTTPQTVCNPLRCTTQQQTWTSASASGNKDRICSAGRSYRDCLGSSCSAVVAPVTRLLEQQGCGSSTTPQTVCNPLRCTTQQQTWTSASASGNKDRICSAGRSYRDCLGSSCSAVVAPVTRLLEQQGCGSSTTPQTVCNPLRCTTQQQTWTSASASGNKDRICSAGRSYRDCLGSSCSAVVAPVTRLLEQQGCGSSTTPQTVCNPLRCTTQQQTWTSASASGNKDRICSAGRSYRDCLGSSCSAVVAPVTRLLEQQGCGSSTTPQTVCNPLRCTTQQQTWTSASASGNKDRICSAGRSYRDCLGSSCSAVVAPVTRLLEQQGCGSSTTPQTVCNPLRCTTQQQTWTSASASGNKDRICSAGRSYRDCLGSSCSAVVAPVTRLLEQQGCGSSTTPQTVCNPLRCTTQQQTWTSASASGNKDRICSAGRSYRDCLGSSCSAVVAPVTRLLEQQGCGSERVWMSASSLLMTVVLTKIFM